MQIDFFFAIFFTTLDTKQTDHDGGSGGGYVDGGSGGYVDGGGRLVDGGEMRVVWRRLDKYAKNSKL